MNKIKKLLAIVLAASIALMCFAFVGCGEKTVDKIEVSKNPTKIVYNVGDTFSVEGGEITVTYTDGKTEVVSMTAEDVEIRGVTPGNVLTIGDPSVDSEDKTITVHYGGKNARFKITVSHAMIDVTFDYGYTGATAGKASVRRGGKVTKPTNTTREGFTLDNWYSDSTLTMAYDFDTEISEPITIYAKWLDNTKTYYDVSFDYNYSGAVDPIVQKVEANGKAVKLAVDPAREGYEFVGWCSDAAGNTAYSFDAAVTAAITIYAKWNRTAATGAQEYVFEAEYTDLNGKNGPGLSGSAPGTAMIQHADNLGASNGYFVGYQYDSKCSLEFRFVSDMAVNDAKIVLRLSAEMRDYNMNPENYMVMLNSQQIEYSEIKFVNVPKASSDDVGEVHALPFQDYTIAVNVSLKEGLNTIVLQTANDHPLEGTTVLSDAPLIDCIKITTSAVLTWSTAHGLPKKDNIK